VKPEIGQEGGGKSGVRQSGSRKLARKGAESQEFDGREAGIGPGRGRRVRRSKVGKAGYRKAECWPGRRGKKDS
jgi:hypothetical protein